MVKTIASATLLNPFFNVSLADVSKPRHAWWHFHRNKCAGLPAHKRHDKCQHDMSSESQQFARVQVPKVLDISNMSVLICCSPAKAYLLSRECMCTSASKGNAGMTANQQQLS
ncbi:unnamed protein product [Polarella glacialis]|uniref:Uncharacterized protein n=1 Tax=Polarella glacialis TaxID=89957 RepID=A0A813E394_POLGL|nr:unnamed protein product [Polarella glacialis]